MKITFYILAFLVFYCYVGYPLLISLMAKLLPRSVRRADVIPTVSVVISVCNEEDVIEAKIKNLLSLDYPAEKMEILVGSDGSQDKTGSIIERFADPRIRFFKFVNRRGKVATLNDIVSQAKNEIIVFTDARQIFAEDALRELVKNFADPKVGCVSGELIFFKEEGATGKGIKLYWDYEKLIRDKESRVHSMLGATGAIYAVRRVLYVSPPVETVLDDMFIPFKVIEKGCRAIFDHRAKAYDRVAESPKEEYRRKARTLFGNYQIFCMMPGMFNPFKSPIALQLFSHKFLRVVMPFVLVVIFIVNFFLVNQPFFGIQFVLQVLFYLMAMTGALLRYEKYGILCAISKVCYIPYVFCLLNFSALIGFFKFTGNKQEALWIKARAQST